MDVGDPKFAIEKTLKELRRELRQLKVTTEGAVRAAETYSNTVTRAGQTAADDCVADKLLAKDSLAHLRDVQNVTAMAGDAERLAMDSWLATQTASDSLDIFDAKLKAARERIVQANDEMLKLAEEKPKPKRRADAHGEND